jgi:hypothetical protein
MVFVLAALTRGLFNRVWGADDPSFRPVMGTRGASGVATSAGSSSNESTTEAAASEAPSRWARAVRERAGASPRVRRAASSGGQEDMAPLIGFALAHAEQAALHHLEAVGLQVSEQEEQPVFGRREGTVLVYAKSACGPGFAIKAPPSHMRLEGGLEGRDHLVKRVKSQAREIQELCRARLHIGTPDTGQGSCLLSWEAQYTINRDNLI